MAKSYVGFSCTVFLFLAVLIYPAFAFTDPLDVTVLQDLYKALNCPPQLMGWKWSGGDPCGESWKGVSCSGSSVISIKLNGLELGGYLGGKLYNLLNLNHLDVSFNHIQGQIPLFLPPNATHIDLAYNNFSQNIPYSLTFMKYLHYLNLSHNSLSGPIGNVFTGLNKLEQMDISYNNITGDLPSSFGNLTNLTGLFLQNNKLTGSVIFLANLPLSDLDIQNNHFSGLVPQQFKLISNLWIGGNVFQIGSDYPPWDLPSLTIPSERNISSRPATSAIEYYPSLRVGKQKQKRLGPGGIACMVGGGFLVATCMAVIIAIRINRSRVRKLESLESNNSSSHTLPISTTMDESFSTAKKNPQSLPGESPAISETGRMLSVRNGRTEKINNRKSFPRESRNRATAKLYTAVELQSATNSFREDNLLGEGSLGSVYKAEFPDGQILVVKSINTVALSIHEEERFLDVVWNVACLRHPNIVTLIGYCMEHGHHLLVYEYVRNWSLDTALHGDDYKHLPWSIRIKIALGIARALDYLHSKCSPPVAHSNLKATNILLDDDLMPRLCDSGLAVLRPLTSNAVKFKASALAISCTGYAAPEHGQPGVDNTKSDIYAFGVLLLEILTGRRPFDSSRPSEEQSLVNWASYRLHDYNALEQMVDPSIKRTLSSKDLSRFADIISLCIQHELEFRPSMSEVAESLAHLIDRTSTPKRISADGAGLDASETSFRTTYTGFVCSPTASSSAYI